MNISKTIAVAIIISLILAINAFTLMRFPPPNGDEAWMASRALEVIQSGKSFGSLDSGVLDQYEGYENFNPWLSSAIQSLGIRIFGTPSLMAIRFVSLMVGFALLASVFWIGTILDGWNLGLLGVVLTAFSWSFLLSAHLGRPDIISVAFGYSAIALYLYNRSANILVGILTGLIAALAFEVHPNGVIYPLTISVLFFYRYKWSLFRKLDFWGFIAGGAIGIIFYLSLHVLPNPTTFLRLNQIVFSFTHIPPLFTGDLQVLIQALKDMVLTLLYTYPIILLGIWALYRFRKIRPPYLPILLVINAVIILSFTLLIRNKFLFYYSIHLSPALCLLVAAFFNDLLKSPTQNRFIAGFRILIVAFVCFIPLFQVLGINSLPDYQQVQSQVNQVIKPHTSIIGNQLYWFGLGDHTYYSWENLVFYKRDKPNSSLEDAFRFLAPDYFIWDNQVNNFTFDTEKKNTYFQGFRISRIELEAFLNNYAEIEATIEEGDLKLEIYRIYLED